jgi:DNA polymerase-3 subunit delta
MKDWQVDRARRDLTGWNETSLGMAIQAAARADAEVKGASRDPSSPWSDLSPSSPRAPFGA